MIADDFISTEHRLGAQLQAARRGRITRRGVWVWDVEGNRWPRLPVRLLRREPGPLPSEDPRSDGRAGEEADAHPRAFRNDQLALFYEEIAALTTGSHKVLPMNSGAEAVESAVKAVRKWGYEVKGVPEGRARIIVASDNFHGRTLGIVGFSTDLDARGGFGPFAPGFVVVLFGDADAFEKAITPNTVAFLVEPIQGEAGVVIPAVGYFAGCGNSARQTTSRRSSTRSRPGLAARESCSPSNMRASRPT